MKSKKCFLFVFNGFADWEPSLIVSSLNKYTDFEIKSFSKDGKAIVSMGNLSIKPDLALNDIHVGQVDLLLLPGGDAWEKGENLEVSSLVTNVFEREKPIAAICAATTLLARLGIFKQIKHTSNGLEYLKKLVPNYEESSNYINLPYVIDKNIITANGAAMIDFAYAVFEKLQVFKPEELKWWYELYKSSGKYL